MKRPHNNNNSEHFIKETEWRFHFHLKRKVDKTLWQHDHRFTGNVKIDYETWSLNWIVKPQPRELSVVYPFWSLISDISCQMNDTINVLCDWKAKKAWKYSEQHGIFTFLTQIWRNSDFENIFSSNNFTDNCSWNLNTLWQVETSVSQAGYCSKRKEPQKK